MNIGKHFKIWSVYVMAAPTAQGLTYFKVGRTSDVAKRVCAVQTGCPLKITRAWVISVWDNRASLALERSMQEWLEPFHSHGEWFAMDPADPAHKGAMNEAFSKAVRFASQGSEVRWREMSVAELRKAMAEQAAEVAETRAARSRKKLAFAAVMMARAKRRIL